MTAEHHCLRDGCPGTYRLVAEAAGARMWVCTVCGDATTWRRMGGAEPLPSERGTAGPP